MDRIDRQILNILQADNRIANTALAERVGLSAPACSRRVTRLQQEGVIEKNVAILNPAKVGQHCSAVVTVSLNIRRKAEMDAFAEKMARRPEVSQCMLVSGAVDYVVVVTTESLEAYKDLSMSLFGGDENVKSYESWLVLARTKFDTKIEVGAR